MATLPKAIYRFNANSFKISMFTILELIILKFIWNHKRPRTAKVIVKKRTKLEHMPPRLQTILQSYSN